jgi:cell wall-associated NlpC family hydrolase
MVSAEPPETMRVHKTPWLRRLGVLVGIASLGVGVLAAPAGADKIADKKAEAARIAAQVQAQGEKVSVLAEKLNQARINADRVNASLAGVQAELAQTDALVAQARTALKGHVVQSYIKGGNVGALQMLVGGKGEATELAVRSGYLKAVAGKERAALDDLAAAREQADAKRAQFEAAQKQAHDALAAVQADQRAAAAAQTEAEATLSQVKGDLAQLVAAEAQRQAAAAAAKAQADLAARQARAASRNRSIGNDPGFTTAPSPGAAAAVEKAREQLGKPYEYGGAGPNSYDCSGLTMVAWRAGGVSLPHSAADQYNVIRHVSMGDLEPGDLVFYGSPIHHVGIYVGNGTMIEAPHSGTDVRYASIYRSDLVGAGRPG